MPLFRCSKYNDPNCPHTEKTPCEHHDPHEECEECGPTECLYGERGEDDVLAVDCLSWGPPVPEEIPQPEASPLVYEVPYPSSEEKHDPKEHEATVFEDFCKCSDIAIKLASLYPEDLQMWKGTVSERLKRGVELLMKEAGRG